MSKDSITIYDVAREANVSMATVSRVVNGNPNVKPLTRERVLDVITRLDYRPNAVARGLASKRSTTIGVIIPDIANTYFSTLARGIDDVAMMYKYDLILTDSDGDPLKEVRVFNNLLAKQVDGIVLLGHRVTDALRVEIARSRIPVVVAGLLDPDQQVGSVNIDYGNATFDAVSLLTKQNQKIAFVSGPLIDPINEARLAGYEKALKKSGLDFQEHLIFEANYNYKAGLNIAEKIIKSGATAAFVADDQVAAGLLNSLFDQGIKVPEEFELITSNDSIIAQLTRPALSSIMLPIYDLGAVSMRLLTKLINKEEVDKKTIILPYKVKERQSTK
ncbi:MAG: catabolite control protein A [Streptococcaceae bacterium]|jgi:LacI family transcriptional regulator|nr:catabolite control protein A [Streptococcaceae bacterium]